MEAAVATKTAPAANPGAAAVAAAPDLFVRVPETKLPNGTTVPAFNVGQYLCSKGADGLATISADGAPWVNVTYHNARKACEARGYALITELQALALAHHIAQQGANWSGGKVGEGDLKQGLRNWTVRKAQPGTFTPPDATEDRKFVLANGEFIFDPAGNAFTWTFDDVQGDATTGIVAKAFAADSPSITTAPAPSLEKGVGWYPDAEEDWSGFALVRGGYWRSESNAGVFLLDFVRPGLANDLVGFRCTTPIGP